MKAPFAKAIWFATPLLILGILAWLIRLTLPGGDEVSIPCAPNTAILTRLNEPDRIAKALSQPFKKMGLLAEMHQNTQQVMQVDTLSRLFQAGPQITILWARAGRNLQPVYYMEPRADRGDWQTLLQGWADMRAYSLREVVLSGYTVVEVRAGRKGVFELFFGPEAILLSPYPTALESYLESPKKDLVVKRALPGDALAGICIFLDESTALMQRIGITDAVPVAMRNAFDRLDVSVFPASKKTELGFTANFKFEGDKCRWPEQMQNVGAFRTKKEKTATPGEDLWTDWAINTEAEEVMLRPRVLGQLAGFDRQMLEVIQTKPQLACGFGDEAEGTLGFCLKLSGEEGVAILQDIIKRTKASPAGTAGNTTVWQIRAEKDSLKQGYFIASRNEWLIMSRSMAQVSGHLERLPESFTEKAFSEEIDLKRYFDKGRPGWISEQFMLFPLTVSALHSLEYGISGANLSGTLRVLTGSYLQPRLARERSSPESSQGIRATGKLALCDQMPGYAYSGHVGDSMIVFDLVGAARLAFKQNNPLVERPICATLPEGTYAFVVTKGGVTALGFDREQPKAVLVYPKDRPATSIQIRKYETSIYLCMQTGDRDIYTATFAKGAFSEWSQLLDRTQIVGAPVLAAEPRSLFVVYPVAGDSIRAIPITGATPSITRHDSIGSGRIQLFTHQSQEGATQLSMLTTNGLYHRFALDSAGILSSRQIYRPSVGTAFRLVQAQNHPDRFCVTRDEGAILSVYGDDLGKRFSIPSPPKGYAVEAYLFNGIQEYYRIGGAWYNRIGQAMFQEEGARPVDFFFEQHGEVKGARSAEGRLVVYGFH